MSKLDDNNNSDKSEEEQLTDIMGKREWNYAKKEWSRRTRSKGAGAATYSDILQALLELEKVGSIVLHCYTRHRKVFKRLGPKSPSGGLQTFLQEVQNFRCFLEEVFFFHLRTIIPPRIPNEILKIIWDFSQTGKSKFDFGFFTEKNFDQHRESIQRKKFLVMTNTMTLNLIYAITMSRMDMNGATIETQMKTFVSDAEAFRDLTEDSKLDFSKFSKIPKAPRPVKKQQVCSPTISNYLTSSSAASKSSHGQHNNYSQEHDYALAGYMH